MRGACTDSMIKPDVPLQGFEPSSSSSHVHIRYNLPVVLRPPSLQTIAFSWAPQRSGKVVCEGQTSHVCTLSKLQQIRTLFTAQKHMKFAFTSWPVDVKTFSPKCSELSYSLWVVIKINRLSSHCYQICSLNAYQMSKYQRRDYKTIRKNFTTLKGHHSGII